MENGAGHASTAGHAHIHQRHGHNKLRHGAAGSRRDGVGGKVVDGAVVELDVERLREARARYFATPHENPEEVENAGIKSAEINDSAKRRSWFTSMKDEQADGHELMRGHATKTSVDKSKKQTLREDSVHAHGRPERKPSGNSTCEPPTKSSNVRKSKSAVSPDSGTYRTRRIDWSSVVTRISSGRTKSASKIPSPVKLVEKHDERHGGLVENPCGIAAPIGMNDIDWVKDVKRAGGDRVDGDCRVEPMSSVIRETGNPKLSNTKVSPLMRPSLRRSKTTTNAHPSSSQAESSLSTMLPKQANMHRSTKGAHITPRRTLSDLSLHFPKMAPPEPVQTLECLTCTDEVPTDKAAKLACDHVMCHSCLKHVFEMSITDPHHMPPKCCTSNHIPLRHVDALLTDDFKRTWNKKYQEYTTKNRLYCPKRGCGTWLSAPLKEEKSTGRKYAKCEKCATKVCPNCNGKWHRGSRCPDDTATKEFLEVAKKAGWQTCYNCKATVELKEGCNHMTCRCRAQFCMICGAKWKTCDCPWFSDMNIYYPGHAPRGNPAHRDFPAFNIRPFLRYPQEMEARRRQEQSDEALARRLQMGLIVNDDMDEVPAIFQNYLNPRRAVDVNFPVLRDLAAPLLGAPLAQQAQRLAEGLLNDFFGTNSATPPVEETANSEPGPRLYRQATAQETLSQQGIHQQGTLAPRGNRQPPSTDDVRTLAHDRTPGYWHREENSPTRFIYRPAGSPVGLSAVAGTEGVNTRHARVSDWLNQSNNGRNYATYLIGVQSVVIDSEDRLCILDTGRVIDPKPGPTQWHLLTALSIGLKLVGVNLTTNEVFRTITFPNTVVYPDSYINDGIALSPDGATLYWSAVASRHLCSIPTAALRDHSATSEVATQAAVQNHGQTSVADGMETDSNALVYRGATEPMAIVAYNPANSTLTTFVRDPRIHWVDTMSIATDGYLYFTVNQLNYLISNYPGYGPEMKDRRERPFVLFRAELPNKGTKISPGGSTKYD